MPTLLPNLTGLVGAGQRTYKSLADLFSSDFLSKYGRNTSMWGALSAPVEQMTPEQQRTLRNTAIIAGVGGPFVGPVNAAIDAGLMALPETAGNLGQLVQMAASRRSGGRNLKELANVPVTASAPESAQIARPARPTLPPIENNYLKPLSEYTPTLYRETSLQDVFEFLEPRGGTPQEFYTANTPDLALGQGRNRGVMVEMDSAGLEGQVNTAKPAWQYAWDQGQAEFRVKYPKAEAMRNAVRSVTVRPEALKQREARPYVQRLQGRMRNEGWTAQQNPDGSVTWRKPEATAPEAK